MFEVRLGRGYASLLKHVKVLMNLFLVEFGRNFPIMQRDGCNVHRIVLESAWAAA